MMDYDELVPYEGEMVPMCDLDGDQIYSIIVDLESQRPPVNYLHEKHITDLTSDLTDELAERSWQKEDDNV